MEKGTKKKEIMEISKGSQFVCVRGAIGSITSNILSTTEAEYMALSDYSQQGVWIQNISTELGLRVRPTQICVNHESGIFIASNPVQEQCTKHTDVQFHTVCNLIKQKQIDIV
jgi:hypothetical protein